jgi:hypothetical protein
MKETIDGRYPLSKMVASQMEGVKQTV